MKSAPRLIDLWQITLKVVPFRNSLSANTYPLVDDSAVVRQVMQGVLGADPKIRVRVAADPIIALAKIEKETPDVVITDLVMPRMDGLTFLRKIMADGPLPVVVCSEVAHRRTEDAISALELEAVEVITKPKLGVRDFLHESAVILIDVVHSAAQAKLSPARFLPVAPRNTADVILPFSPAPPQQPSGDKVIAIGASTGGTEALREFLQAMPLGCPGIVMVQHIADRLNRDRAIEVKEASDGDPVLSGRRPDRSWKSSPSGTKERVRLHCTCERRTVGVAPQTQCRRAFPFSCEIGGIPCNRCS